MGLYDVETMNLLRAELDKLPGGRDILMYGEPWQGGCSALHRYEANKNNLNMPVSYTHLDVYKRQALAFRRSYRFCQGLHY